jgi:hypothetical protein
MSTKRLMRDSIRSLQDDKDGEAKVAGRLTAALIRFLPAVEMTRMEGGR